MKDITTCCEKTIKSTNESIKNTETTFRNSTEKQKFLNIEKLFKKNAEAATREIEKVQLYKI